MQLILENGSKFHIELSRSPVAPLVERWFRHLRHVDLPFRPWEYSGYNEARSRREIVDALATHAQALGISVDRDSVSDQDYLNKLHEIYENNYDGQQAWTDYHEHIHFLEPGNLSHERTLELNYRHLAGPLNQPFQMAWLAHGTTKLQAGDVYLAWDELGKTPHTYWTNHEPDDLIRLCQLAKPWLTIRPKLNIRLSDTDRCPEEDKLFRDWWNNFERDWCAHWRIPSWSQRDSRTVLVIGNLADWKDLEKNLDQKSWPRRVIL